jgi:hypothetical protein
MILVAQIPCPLIVFKRGGVVMRDEHLKPKKLLRGGLVMLAGIFIGQCIVQYILHRHAFSGQGFNAFPWDRLVLQALGATGLLICVWLVGRGSKETPTLGIGESTLKKLR